MNGLNDKEVIINREKYGNNSLIKTKSNSFIKQLIISLSDPMIKILLIALGIKTVFLFKNFDWFETVGIVIAIFFASFVSTISEYGSEKAFEKLQEEASLIKVKVKRNGKVEEIDINDIVVNDIVYLESGDKVPADGYIIFGNIMVDESSLNGESKEISKNAKINEISYENIVYRGSVVSDGECFIKITNVGMNTMYGQLADSLQIKPSISPLKQRLQVLARFISKIGYLGAFFVFISYLFSIFVIKNNFDLNLIIKSVQNIPYLLGHILYALTLSVTIIVVAVPEGLPMMITLVLSTNMKKMLKNNVLVRKLVGIETSGNINILFTDKTGTITKGKLEVIGIISGDNDFYTNEFEMDEKYREVLKESIIYNVSSGYSNTKEVIGGNTTDKAILSFIKSNYILKYKKNDTKHFDSKNKYSKTTIVKDNKEITYIKGAKEIILPKCDQYVTKLGTKRYFTNKKNIENKIIELEKSGIRILVSAIKENNYYVFIGLILIKDELRKESIEGLKKVSEAGIQVTMITGDNINTAYSIGCEVGLIKNKEDICLTSKEFNEMNDEEIKKILPNLKILARALPQDKTRLVRISKDKGLIVGMTGDGVNDAPALKCADVGFALGSGTEIAKEASDIVILDDNLLSISNAILYGRTIFKSIRKFIIFQLTVNFCAISLSIIGPFIGVNTPVTVIQMLWINMVMDTLAGLAFSYEPALEEYMKVPPKDRNEQIVNKYMINQILSTGLFSSIICILFLKLPLLNNIFNNKDHLITAFFGLFIFMGIFNAFNARTERINILSNLNRNKIFLFVIGFIFVIQIILIYFGGNLFRTTGLNLLEFEMMIIISISVIPFDIIRKILLRKKGLKGGV